MRDGNWKLLCNYDGTQPELYDLSQDIGETTNLAQQHADVAKRLASTAVAWHQSMPADKGAEIGAQVPKPKRTLEPKSAASRSSRPNVLLLLVDDLKPTLGCYGDVIARTRTSIASPRER